MTTTEHEPVVCIRDVAGTQYVGKGYRSRFTCPTCLRSCWQHLGFLGRRKLICNGLKFSKQPQQGPDAPLVDYVRPSVPYLTDRKRRKLERMGD